MKNIFLTTILLLVVSASYAQKKKADNLYKKLGYKASIPLFEDRDNLSTDDLIRIANSYRLNHDVISAELWYSQVVQESSEPIHFLHYAQALHSNEKYEQAKEYYSLYNERIGGSDQRGANLKEAIEQIKNFKHTNSTIKNESAVNSGRLDFSPAFYQDGIVFVSSRDPKKGKKEKDKHKNGVDPWMNDNYMSLFYADKNESGDLKTPEVFSTNISTKYHEGPVCFNKSGDKLFFSRNQYYKGKRKNDKKGIMKMNIYSAIRAGEDWKNVKELGFNTEEYDEVHPALSADGSQLYFASNRDGGLGGMDIYVATFSAGQWSEPVNLGSNINTPGNEIFPFMHDDGTLYFASDGWGGLGGLDIFSAIKTEENNWDQPINIGTPFNSSKDDFSFILNTTGTEGYLSSARDGGSGQDDIYSFKTSDKDQLGRQVKATICVYDATTNERIEGVSLSISQEQISKDEELEDFTMRLVQTDTKDEYLLKLTKDGGLPNNKETVDGLTNENGDYNMEIIPNEHYYIVAQKDGYVVAEQAIHTQLDNGKNVFEHCIPLVKSACVVLKGKAINQQYESLIPNVTVTLTNLCDGESQTVKTDRNGNFSFPCLPCHCEFELNGQKVNFKSAKSTASTMNMACASGGVIKENLLLLPGKDEEPVMDKKSNIREGSITESNIREGSITESNIKEGGIREEDLTVGNVLELKKIYYDFDKYYIRDGAQESLKEVVELMKRYPSLVVELSAHTDARGTTNYNRWLSRLRAKEAVQYVVDHGIESWRLKSKGYGEAKLRNDCADGVTCNEEEHQYNRRTEVKILEFDRNDIEVNYIDNEPSIIDSAPGSGY